MTSLARRRFAAAVCLAVCSVAAVAQTYPEKPVRLLVGFAAGGPTDIMARMYGERLAQKLKQPFVVENVAGANGDIAARQIMSRPADGYTLLWAPTSQLVYGPALQKAPRFDPVKDFSLIAAASGSAYMVVTSTSLPVNDMKEFVDYAKKNPGKLSFSSGGSANHLAGEWLTATASLDLRHIPYKGDAAAVADLIGGLVTIGFLSPNVALPLVKSGKLKALAVTSPTRRKEILGDVPTMVEAGFKNFSIELFNGLVARTGTPPEIVRQLHAAMNEISSEPEIRTKLAGIGQYPMSMSSDQFRNLVEKQGEHWRGVIKAANIQQE